MDFDIIVSYAQQFAVRIGPDPHFGCCVLMVAFKCKMYVGPKLLQDTLNSVTVIIFKSNIIKI